MAVSEVEVSEDMVVEEDTLVRNPTKSLLYIETSHIK